MEPVRAYLLGTLDPEKSAALEDRYFSDDSFFGRVQEIESRLIREYLDRRLTGAELEQFESRYLRIPVLQQKFQEVSRQYSESRPNVLSTVRWRLSFAMVLTLCIGLAAWLFLRGGSTAPRPVPDPPAIIALTIRLAPGLLKSGASSSTQFELPQPDSAIKLVLELPGVDSAVDATATIRAVTSGPIWKEIWKGPGILRSTRTATGQEVAIVLKASLLPPDDYVVELSASPDLRETYVFRMTAPR